MSPKGNAVIKIAEGLYKEYKENNHQLLNKMVEKYKNEIGSTQKSIIRNFFPSIEEKQLPAYVKMLKRHIQENLGVELAKTLGEEKSVKLGQNAGRVAYQKKIVEEGTEVVSARYKKNSTAGLLAQGKVPYVEEEKTIIQNLKVLGKTNQEIAGDVNEKFHKKNTIRTAKSISDFLAKEQQKIKKLLKVI